MSKIIRALYIDDNPLDRDLVRDALEKEHGGFELIEVSCREELGTRLDEGPWDIILSDFNILGLDGFQVIDLVRTKCPETPIVIVTGTGSEEVAVESIRRGAADYVIKTPQHIRHLPVTIQRALEQQKAKDELHSTLGHLSMAMNAARAGSWEWNLHTNENIWSDELWELYGLEPHSCAPSYDAWKSIIHPEDRETFEKIMQEAASKGADLNFEFRVLDRDGTVRTLLSRGRPLRDADGRLERYIGIVLDITERKRAEEQIRQNEIRLKSLVRILQHSTATTQEFLDYALNEAIGLTESKIGYIYFYHEDRKQFVLNTWSRDVMKECSVVDPQTCYELDKTGVWGEAVRQRKPIIINDFQAGHPLQKGYPKGHVHLHKFMTVPIFRGDQIVAVVGMANKESDYNETDVLQLTLLMDAVWKAVEIKKSEEALHESEQRFRLFYEHSPVAYQSLDAQGNILEVNKAWLDELGYTKEEVIGRWFGDFLAGDGLAQFPARFERFKAAGEVHGVEFELRRKDGILLTATFEGRIARDAAGAFSRTHCVFVNITERKRAEEALRASEAQLSNALEIARLGHWEYDVASNLFTFNDGFYAILRTTAEQEGGYKMSPARYAERFVHPDDRFMIGEEVKKALETDDPNYSRQLEHRIIYANGDIGHISVRFRILKDAQGRTIKTYGANQDITERKRAEETLRESEERYRSLFRNNMDAVLLTAPDGRVFAANEVACRMFGLSEAEICRRGRKGLVDQQDPRLSALLNERARSGKAQGEINCIRADGSIFPADVTSSVFETSQGARTCLVLRDITERKRAEEALRHSEMQGRLVWENAMDGMRLTDAEGNVHRVNEAYCRLVEKPREELEGHSMAVAYLESKQSQILEKHKQRFRERSIPPYLEREITLWNGKTVRLEVVSTFLAVPGEPELVLSVFRDITKRKLAEEALQLSEARLEAAQTRAKSGSWELDLTTQTGTWSAGMFQLFGRDPAKGVPPMDEFLELLHPDDRHRIQEGDTRAIRTAVPHTVEFRSNPEHGPLRYFSNTLQAVRDSEGRPAMLAGTVMDITDRKQIEQALHERNERMTLLNRVAQATVESRTPEEMVDNLLAIIRKIMPCDAFYIDSYDEASMMIQGVKSYDTVDGVFGPVPLQSMKAVTESAYYKTVILNRRSLRILRNDGSKEVHDLATFGDKTRRSASLLFAPMIARNRVVGVLSVQSYSLNAYSEKDELLLYDIALQAGAAFESAQLYADALKAQTALQETHEIYRKAIVQASAVPYQLDFNTGRYLFMGEDIESLTGYSVAEMDSARWGSMLEEQVMLGEGAGLTPKEAHARALSGEIGAWRSEVRIRTRKGEIRWLSDSSVILRDNDNKAFGSLGILQDITERKQAELAIKEQNDRTALLNRVAQAVIESRKPEEMLDSLAAIAREIMPCDAFSAVTYDESAGLLHGVRLYDTIDGKFQLVPSQTVPLDTQGETFHTVILGRKSLRILRSQESQRGLDLSPFGDKTRRSASLLFVPLISRNKVIGRISVQSYTPNAYSEKDENLLMEIARQAGPAFESAQLYADALKAQAALRETHEIYRSAIVQANAVPYQLDYDTGRYIFIGEDIERLTGFPAKDFDIRKWDEILQETIMLGEASGLSTLEAHVRAKAGEIGTWRSEIRIRTRSGETRWLADSSVLLYDDAGKATGSLGILLDITERKQSELAIKEQNNRTALLNRVAQVTIESHTLEEMADNLIAILREVMPCDAAYMDAFDEANLLARGIRSYDTIEGEFRTVEAKTVSVNPQSSVDSVIFFQRKPVRILRAEEPERGMYMKAFGDTARRSGSLLYVPMIARNRVVGSISVQSYTHNAYSEKEESLLFEIARQAGPAFESIKLYLDTKKAEEALAAERNMLRTLIDSLPDFVYVKDRESRFVIGNHALARNLREATPEGIVGKTDRDYFDPERAARFAMDEQKVMHTGQPIINQEECIEDASGNPLWLLTTKVPLRDFSGKVAGIVGIGRDITEHKRAEAERQRLYDTLNASVNEIYMFDAETLRFEFVSEGALRNLGYTLEQMRTMTPLDIKPSLTPESFAALVQPLRDGTKRVVNFDASHQRVDGTEYPVDVHLQLLGEIHPIFLAVIVDSTERKKLEAQFLQAQKMEVVGRLAGGVAHDFNNMLQTILGYNELVLDAPGISGPMRENLLEIQKAAKRSADLTRQLLAFARKQTVSPKVLDLNDTVEGMLKMLRRLIGEEIDLAWMPALNLWPVKIDPSQIDQLLANLAVNARDAISGAGKVTIETRNITFNQSYCDVHDGVVPGPYVMLAVSDDGCGMDKRTLAHIFEPFFTTKEMGKGTGLGLATVYGIVKQNNGFINVYSEPGRGTTFKLYLPRHGDDNSFPNKPTSAAAILHRGTETVLIVEDEESILNLGKTILQGLGYTVLASNTPQDAIELVSQYSGVIHLLITDVVMPEMDGREMAKRLHEIKPDMKCLFMSGYTADVIAHRGVLDEGVQFLPKPFSAETLSAMVRQALEK